MITRIRSAMLALAFLPLALAGPNAATAQDWPARNVTVVVPLGAGSASDIMARVVMDQVGRQVGRTFVVENRPGAGGTVGANAVANAPADGYTILAYGALATAHALYTKLPYDTLTAFAPVIPFGQQPLVVVVAPSKGYKTLGDLTAAAKAKPGAMNYSSAGVGSASHFAAERATPSAATLPPAPGRFSTTNGCPSRSDNHCAITRATMSIACPAGKPTTMRTARDG